MIARVIGQGLGVRYRFIEVATMDDHLGTESRHGTILIGVIAFGDNDTDAQSQLPGGIGNALPMIAAGRRDHAGNVGVGGDESLQVDQPAADFEGPRRIVVLVFDEDAPAASLVQQGPLQLRGWLQVLVHDGRGLVQRGQIGRKGRRQVTRRARCAV